MIIKTATVFLFYMLYWFCCFLATGTDRKNLAGLRSYPDAVQQAVRKHHILSKTAPQKKSTWSILLGNLIFFTMVFSVLWLTLKNFLRLNDFKSAFLFFFILGEGLGVFDLLVIDLLWWRNTKRIRFSFLPDKKYYQDSTNHIKSFARGIPLFALTALFCAGITIF